MLKGEIGEGERRNQEQGDCIAVRRPGVDEVRPYGSLGARDKDCCTELGELCVEEPLLFSPVILFKPVCVLLLTTRFFCPEKRRGNSPVVNERLDPGFRLPPVLRLGF